AGGEMPRDVAAGAEDALFLASPERGADGAAGLEGEGPQNAHGCERDDGASAIVGGPGAGDPAVEVSAEHHDLVFEGRIRTRNFRKDVLALDVLSGELCLDPQAHGHGNV